MKKKTHYKEVQPQTLGIKILIIVGVSVHSRAMGNFYLSFIEG